MLTIWRLRRSRIRDCRNQIISLQQLEQSRAYASTSYNARNRFDRIMLEPDSSSLAEFRKGYPNAALTQIFFESAVCRTAFSRDGSCAGGRMRWVRTGSNDRTIFRTSSSTSSRAILITQSRSSSTNCYKNDGSVFLGTGSECRKTTEGVCKRPKSLAILSDGPISFLGTNARPPGLLSYYFE